MRTGFLPTVTLGRWQPLPPSRAFAWRRCVNHRLAKFAKRSLLFGGATAEASSSISSSWTQRADTWAMSDVWRRQFPNATASQWHMRFGESVTTSSVEQLLDELVRKYETQVEAAPGTPADTSPTPAQLIQKVIEFLRGLGLSVEDAGRVIHKRPQILRLSLKSQAAPIIHFLVRDLGLTDAQVRRAVRHAPQIFEQPLDLLRSNARYLSRPTSRRALALRIADDTVASHATSDPADSVERSVASAAVSSDHGTFTTSANEDDEDGDARKPHQNNDLVAGESTASNDSSSSAMEALSFGRRQLARAVAKCPGILWRSPATMARMVYFFRSEMGCNARETAHVLSLVPQLLLRSPDELLPQVSWLRRHLRRKAADGNGAIAANQRDLARLVVQYPTSLLLDPMETMQPRLDYLRDHFGVSDFRRCLLNSPTVLEASIERDLAGFKRVLVDSIGFASDDPALATIATKVPKFFHTRPQLIFEFLTREAGLDPAEARTCLALAPTLVLLSGRRGQPVPSFGTHLFPYLHFCTQVLGRSLVDVLRIAPDFLTMDVERRLIPRYAFAKSRLTSHEWQALKLHDLLCSSTSRFCEHVMHVPVSEYQRYVQSGKWLLFYLQIL